MVQVYFIFARPQKKIQSKHKQGRKNPKTFFKIAQTFSEKNNIYKL